jgi:hypothetical protein
MKKIYKLVILLGIFPTVFSAQYFQGFDSAEMPSGWTVISSADQETWRTWDAYDTTFNAPHSGSHFLGLQYRNTAGDYVISPGIAIIAGVSDKLTFWAKNRGAGLTEEIDVKISTTTPTAEGLNKTIIKSLKPSTSWTQYTYDLTAYIGQTIYIGFYSATKDMWFVGIDDFQVSGNNSKVFNPNSTSVSIYPNPVKDVLNIENKTKMTEISIYDLSGRLHQQEKVNTENVNISVRNLPPGNYILRIKERTVEKTYKIIKE